MTQSGTCTENLTIKNNILYGEIVEPENDCSHLGELILAALKKRQNVVAQIDDFLNKQCTFGEMRENSVKCALWLTRQGIKMGDVVAICTHNQLDMYIPWFASYYIGAILNPWDHEMTIRGARNFLKMIRPTIIFANENSARTIVEAAKEEGNPEKLRIIVLGEVEGLQSLSTILKDESLSTGVENFRCTKLPDSRWPAMIMYSSGTTGLPKATELSHAAIIKQLSRSPLLRDSVEVTSLWFTPPYWITCGLLLIRSVMLGARRIIYPYFEEEHMCKLVQKYEVTWIFMGASMCNRTYSSGVLEKYRLTSLRNLIITGAILSENVQQGVKKCLPNAHVRQCYGITECGGVLTYQTKYQKPGSVGMPVNNVQLKVIDVETSEILGPNQAGEICAKTPSVMNGYYNNPQANKEVFDENGWFHTGDLGYWNENGEFFILDRIKELIKFRGVHVSPTEIESLLKSHPAVFEAGVVSIPHPIDEEHPVAFVSTIPGKEVTKDDLSRLVEVNMGDNKRLRGGVHFLNDLPHTPTGKIAKKDLRQLARKLANQ